MEFFGYDFMIDNFYNLWLIEINSSPAMEHSTEITTILCDKVLEDTTKVVVDYTLSKKPNKKDIDTGGFKLIFKGDASSINSAGTQIGLNSIKNTLNFQSINTNNINKK